MKRVLCLIILSTLSLFASAAHFQDSNGVILLRSDTAQFLCPSSEFSLYEPTYEAPPDGAIRIWTDAYQCLQKDGTQYGDPFYASTRFAQYISNISAYQSAYDSAHAEPAGGPYIYVDVSLSKTVLNIDDSNDSIVVQGWLKDEQGTQLPVSDSWIIRLRDAVGQEVDAVMIVFTNGETPQMTYTCPPNVNLGRMHIDEADFLPVEVPGIGTFDVKLSHPVEITIYRQL